VKHPVPLSLLSLNLNTSFQRQNCITGIPIQPLLSFNPPAAPSPPLHLPNSHNRKNTGLAKITQPVQCNHTANTTQAHSDVQDGCSLNINRCTETARLNHPRCQSLAVSGRCGVGSPVPQHRTRCAVLPSCREQQHRCGHMFLPGNSQAACLHWHVDLQHYVK
jgi:hypothetical protein